MYALRPTCDIKPHRAMADILHSIDEYKFYLNHLVPTVASPVQP